MTIIKEIFEKDPTRLLEEVQKVNDFKKIKDDINEFYPTESVKEFLNEVAQLIKVSRSSKFIYLHATFGSGKTHVMKLLNILLENKYPNEKSLLIEKFSPFKEIERSINESNISEIVPVFINLLDRDASKDPPMPLLIYKALSKKVGYPSEPLWLMEISYLLHTEYEMWNEFKEYEYKGKKVNEALKDKATIRSWLIEALYKFSQGKIEEFSAESKIRNKIDELEKKLSPNNFSADDLNTKMEKIKNSLSQNKNREVEFLVGLDEIALFIGDKERRYEELKNTIKALQEGIKPVILGTGQWSLTYFEREFYEEVEELNWCHKQIKLASTDAEIIVRKRWLRKTQSKAKEVKKIAGKVNQYNLDGVKDLEIKDPNSKESYPFRVFDLALLRDIIQGLLTGGTVGEREHVRGRALLVLVRLLFLENLGEKKLGEVVSWNEIYDVLEEHTTYIPTWIQDIINRLQAEKSKKVVKAAKIIFLLNNSLSVPTTIDNMTILLLETHDQKVEMVKEEIKQAIEKLSASHYIYEADKKYKGDKNIFKMLTKEEMSLQEKIESTNVRKSEVRKKIISWLQEYPYFTSERTKSNENIGKMRKVPLRIKYSVYQEVKETPPEYDSINLRVLISNNFEDNLAKWSNYNEGKYHEDILIYIDLPEGLYKKIKLNLKREKVLSEETKRYSKIEQKKQSEETEIKNHLNRCVSQAKLYDDSSEKVGNFKEDFDYLVAERVEEKFPNRKELKKGFDHIEDAKAIVDFFKGERDWPLEKEDANMLGVDRFNRKLSKEGWANDFLENYEAQHRIQGEELIDQIESKGGDYLGTSFEALSCLIVTLYAANKVTVIHKGKVISNLRKIGKNTIRKGRLNDLEIRFEPPVDMGELNKIEKICRKAIGEVESGTPNELLSNLYNWFEENRNDIKSVIKRLKNNFDNELNLLSSLLQKNNFEKEIVLDNYNELLNQIEDYKIAKMIFIENKNVWQRYEEMKYKLSQFYQNENITDEFSNLTDQERVPEIKKLKELLQRAEAMRVNKLKNRYEKLTGEKIEKSEINPGQIMRKTENYLSNNHGIIEKQIQKIENKLPFKVEFSFILRLCKEAKQEGVKLNEERVNKEEFIQEAQKISKSRTLLQNEINGKIMWEKFKGKISHLREKDPENIYIKRWEKYKKSNNFPSISFFKEVIEYDLDKKPDAFEEVWEKLQTLEEGSIIIIQEEDN